MIYIDENRFREVMLKFAMGGFLFFLIIILVSMLKNYNVTETRIPTGGFYYKKELSDEIRDSLLEAIQLKKIALNNCKQKIACFDVNQNEDIAIGFDEMDEKIIAVFTSEGLYKYGYSFKTYGSFYVEWEDENLWIYFVRGDEGILLDKNANCIKCVELIDSYGSDSYWRKLAYGRREMNGNTYLLKQKMEEHYNKLVKINSDGKELVLYDVSLGHIGLIFSVGSILVVLAFLVLFFRRCKIQKKYK